MQSASKCCHHHLDQISCLSDCHFKSSWTKCNESHVKKFERTASSQWWPYGSRANHPWPRYPSHHRRASSGEVEEQPTTRNNRGSYGISPSRKPSWIGWPFCDLSDATRVRKHMKKWRFCLERFPFLTTMYFLRSAVWLRDYLPRFLHYVKHHNIYNI